MKFFIAEFSIMKSKVLFRWIKNTTQAGGVQVDPSSQVQEASPAFFPHSLGWLTIKMIDYKIKSIIWSRML